MVGDPSGLSSGGQGGQGGPIGSQPVSSRRILIGELLVEAGVISREQLAEVLAMPREPGKKIGQLLVEKGWVTEAQLTQTLSLQLSVPWVSLYHIDFSRQLLNRVSREAAETYCLIPIFVRHVKGHGETIYVAMDDPTNDAALAEVSKQAGLPAKPMIASATDIRSAIRVYYGDPAPVIDVALPHGPTTTREGRPREGEGERAARAAAPTLKLRKPDAPPAPVPAATAAAEETPPPTARSSPPSAPPPEPPPAEAPKKKAGKGVSLTLLDGTTISLPTRGKPKKEGAVPTPEGLTARDFVSALRATAHGADATDILGDKPQWEPIVAALLSILLRKGLIADWEFVEELRKI